MKKLMWYAALCCSMMLAACGGGGGDSGTAPFPTPGDPGPGDPGTSGAAIAVSLSQTVVTQGSPATVTATLTDAGTGSPLAGKVVTFTTTGGLGVFSPTAGTALTDANGRAVVSVSPASASANGAAEVTATATINGETVTDSEGFQFTASNVTISSFTADIGSGTLSAYGQTTATVNLAGAAGVPVTVNLTSTCVAASKAEISPASLTTTTGVATFTYRDNGCGATQTTDTLQASLASTAATAQATIALAAPAVSSIGFASATPATIFLKGSGLGESSAVSFEIKDSAGNPLPNRSVTLELTTLTGGLTLEGGSVPVVRTSDANGLVTVLVNSGTVPTPVRVRATLTGTTVSTVSSSLTVAVGLPSQINFGLAQATINIEGYDYIDTPNTYTVIASDRSGNPVPVGTAINFVTEGGQIQASRTIVHSNGIARADAAFVSNVPRPADGRVTILAYALGEESFKDLNGNNLFDSGEPFQDLGDVYKDRLFDDVFDANNDEFVPLGLTGSSACVVSVQPELVLNASIPTRAGTCDGVWGPAYVRRATETVLSTSAADPVWFPGDEPANLTPASTVTRQVGSSAAPTVTMNRVHGSRITGLGDRGNLTFMVRDANGVRINPVAAGSTISVEGTTGLTVRVMAGSPVANSSEATAATVAYEFSATAGSGTLTIRITSPKGLTTVLQLDLVKV
jgi:hypothetical protein